MLSGDCPVIRFSAIQRRHSSSTRLRRARLRRTGLGGRQSRRSGGSSSGHPSSSSIRIHHPGRRSDPSWRSPPGLRVDPIEALDRAVQSAQRCSTTGVPQHRRSCHLDVRLPASRRPGLRPGRQSSPGPGSLNRGGDAPHQGWLHFGHVMRPGFPANRVATLKVVLLPISRVHFAGRLLVVEPPPALVPLSVRTVQIGVVRQLLIRNVGRLRDQRRRCVKSGIT